MRACEPALDEHYVRKSTGSGKNCFRKIFMKIRIKYHTFLAFPRSKANVLHCLFLAN